MRYISVLIAGCGVALCLAVVAAEEPKKPSVPEKMAEAEADVQLPPTFQGSLQGTVKSVHGEYQDGPSGERKFVAVIEVVIEESDDESAEGRTPLAPKGDMLKVYYSRVVSPKPKPDPENDQVNAASTADLPSANQRTSMLLQKKPGGWWLVGFEGGGRFGSPEESGPAPVIDEATVGVSSPFGRLMWIGGALAVLVAGVVVLVLWRRP